MVAAGRSVAGRYTLRREIGRGGMGVVWCAEDELLGREVALKRIGLTPGGNSPDAARAAREARLAATLSHAHVVAVFDLVRHGDEQWLVMEYVDGVDLARLVRARGPLEPDAAASLLCQAADALAAAHRAGIVHRDVKPSNILVTDAGQVKLTDFGIARGLSDATLTATGLMTGSPAYLAPEVASGGTAGPASDVWSLGATLYHALTGEPPYEVAGNVVGALYRIVHEDPPRPGGAGWLTPLLEATMAKDPADRWSMADVAHFLAHGRRAGDPAAPAARSARSGDLTETSVLTTPVAASPSSGDPTVPPKAPGAVRHGEPPSLAPSPSPARAPAPRRPGRAVLLGVVAVLVALLALGGGLALGWSLLAGPGDDQTPSGQSTASPTRRAPSPSPSTRSPSPSPSTPTPQASAEAMRAFVTDYLATVTRDPRAGWGSLTPRFQQASGGFGDYRAWWSRVASTRLGQVLADPSAMKVTYTVTYTLKDGSTTTDDVTLDLVLDGGRYLVDGER